MLPNLLLIIVGQDSVVASLLKKTVFGILCFSVVILPLSFLKPKYYSWFIILILPFIFFETSVINHFKAPSSEEIVATIFLTNYYEITELINGNILSVFFSILLFLGLLFFSYKLRKDFKLSSRIKKRIFIFLLSVLSILYIRNFIAANKLNDNFNETFGLTNYSLKIQLNKVFPLDMFLKLNNAHNGIQKKKNYKNSIKDFRFNAIKKDTLEQQEIYIY